MIIIGFKLALESKSPVRRDTNFRHARNTNEILPHANLQVVENINQSRDTSQTIRPSNKSTIGNNDVILQKVPIVAPEHNLQHQPEEVGQEEEEPAVEQILNPEEQRVKTVHFVIIIS